MVDNGFESVEALSVINDELLREGIQAKGAIQCTEENEVDFKEVSFLSLSYKNLVSILHLHDFHALVKLQLDNNQITKIENLDSLVNLEWLDLSFNRIEKIEGVQCLMKLTDLSLFNNHIEKIEGLDTLINLQILSLGIQLSFHSLVLCDSGNNKISNIQDIECLRKHKNLQVLKLTGNPICKMESYRDYITSRLDHLQSLDFHRLLHDEVVEAKEHYQDDLIEMSEKETALEEAANVFKMEEEQRELMDRANLNGIDNLLTSMENDEDWKKICSIPGMSEAWNETRTKLHSYIEDFKTAMLDQLEKKTKETETWDAATDAFISKKVEECKSLILQYEKQKKQLIRRIATKESCDEDITSSLKSKLTVLKNELLTIEEEILSAQNQFNQEYEAVCDQLSSKGKTIHANFFIQVRDLLNALSSKANTIALGMLEKHIRESDLEKLPEEAKLFINDKDALMTALQNSHDLKISKVDVLEEELLQKEAFTKKQSAMEVELCMKRSHCERINEILAYLEQNTKEIEEMINPNMTSLHPFGESEEPQELDKVVNALIATSKEGILDVLKAKDGEQTFPLKLNFMELCTMDLSIAYELFHRPERTLRELNLACIHAQRHLMKQKDVSNGGIVKESVRIRIVDLFYSIHSNQQGHRYLLGDIVCEHIGRLLFFECLVVRTGERKVSQTHHSSEVQEQSEDDEKENSDPKRVSYYDGDHNDVGSLPQKCRKKPVNADYQEIMVQQRHEQLRVGEMPKTVIVILQDDLVDSCQVGDNIELTGIVNTRGIPKMSNVKNIAEFVIHANNLQVYAKRKMKMFAPDEDFQLFWKKNRDQPLIALKSILSGVCPQIHGRWTIKLALLLLLLGGCSGSSPLQKGSCSRPNLHLLLIGDPGTGKSQFMKFASLVSPNCIITNGNGTSSAGMTASAIKRDGAWSLEAGALVLADGGICCIDEFSGIPESERGNLHEAMEQQTISIAKAGLITTLNARTSVFGCMNPPRESYNSKKSFSETSGLSWPLISRFDLIFLVLDKHDLDSDNALADHILYFHQHQENQNCEWNIRRLQAYVEWVKGEFSPSMSEEAIEMLKKYYQYLRQRSTRTSPRVTVRALESLIRISQAHAKLMARAHVFMEDAIISVLLFESSIFSSGYLDNTLEFLFQSSSSEKEYLNLRQNVLEMIHF